MKKNECFKVHKISPRGSAQDVKVMQILELSRLWEEKNIKFTNPVSKSREPSSMEESDFYSALNLLVEEDKKRDAVDALIELKENNGKYIACSIFSM